jgi:carboxyl-terminal processing protease
MKYLICVLLLTQSVAMATEDKYDLWKNKPNENFSDSEAAFKLVMQKLLDKYIDKSLSKEELYRAATAGMLASLNPGEETWNKLLSPQEVKEIQEDLNGKLIGIGTTIRYDEKTGYGQIIGVIASSPAEKIGVKVDDQILSVDGQKFKGKQFRDLLYAIRGSAGKKVNIKVLREDKVLSFDIPRGTIQWSTVDMQKVNKDVALLAIHYFNEDTEKLTEAKIKEAGAVKKWIIDLRDNAGGGFDQAIATAGLFLQKDKIIASTKSRDGKLKEYRSEKSLFAPDAQVVLLTNKGTYCGAELFAAALRDSQSAKLVGETTSGKWNTQMVEILPNHYAIKYTVKSFQSPRGQSFQDKGLTPDLEVSLAKDADLNDIRLKFSMEQRLEKDYPLKAAVQLLN